MFALSFAQTGARLHCAELFVPCFVLCFVPEFHPLRFVFRLSCLPAGIDFRLARTKQSVMAKRVRLGSRDLKRIAALISEQLVASGRTGKRARAEIPGGADAVASAFLSRHGVCSFCWFLSFPFCFPSHLGSPYCVYSISRTTTRRTSWRALFTAGCESRRMAPPRTIMSAVPKLLCVTPALM